MLKIKCKKKLREIEDIPDLHRVKAYSGTKAFADILADDRTTIPFDDSTIVKTSGNFGNYLPDNMKRLFFKNLENAMGDSDENKEKLSRKLKSNGYEVSNVNWICSDLANQFYRLISDIDNDCIIDLSNNTISKSGEGKIIKTKFTAFLENIVKLHERNQIEHSNDTFKSISKFFNKSTRDPGRPKLLDDYKKQLPDPKAIRAIYNVFNTYVITPMGTKKFILITRNPIDVLRMADFKSLQSCHSPPYPSQKKPSGKFYFCAIQEAEGGGAVAYLVSGQEPKHISQSDEVLMDADRGLKGLNPISRIRIRQVRVKMSDGKEIILAIPEHRIYGYEAREFQVKLVEYFRENQREILDEITKKLIQDASSMTFELMGGSYLDTEIPDLVNLFLNHGLIDSSKIKVEDRIKADRNLENWQIKHLFEDLLGDLFEKVGNGDYGYIQDIQLSPNKYQNGDSSAIVPIKNRFYNQYYVETRITIDHHYQFEKFVEQFVSALNIGIDPKSGDAVKIVDKIFGPINHDSITDIVESFIFDIVFNNDNDAFQKYISQGGVDIDFDEDEINFNFYFTIRSYSEHIDFPIGEVANAINQYFTPEYYASTISGDKKKEVLDSIQNKQIKEQFRKSLPWRQ